MAIRTTAIINMKGGTAKTTTAINMAAILAKHYGKKVLLGDVDSQCNTTEFFGCFGSFYNMATILRHGGTLASPSGAGLMAIQNTEFEGIDLIPGDESLMDMDLSSISQGIVDRNVLRHLMEEVKDVYDYAIIDCPPAFNAASAAALVAADDVIIPIKLDAFSLRGMTNLIRQVQNMRQINPRLKVAGILPTMWYKDPQIIDAEQQLKSAGLPVFHHIRRSDKVDRMTFQQEALLISSPNSAAGVDYRTFVAEYVGGAENGS
jgi:chromosome partitioning protein